MTDPIYRKNVALSDESAVVDEVLVICPVCRTVLLVYDNHNVPSQKPPCAHVLFYLTIITGPEEGHGVVGHGGWDSSDLEKQLDNAFRRSGASWDAILRRIKCPDVGDVYYYADELMGCCSQISEGWIIHAFGFSRST